MDQAPIKVFNKYTNFVNVFSPKLTIEFSKYTKINNHTIELINDQHPHYSLIYSLSLVELKIFKSYIKNYLANGFIKPSKSLTRTPIFFKYKVK